MRTKKTGAALDIYVMSKCVEMLDELPQNRRGAIIDWLAKRNQDPEPQNVPVEQTSYLGHSA